MGLTVTFIDPRGTPVEVEAEAGENLLKVGQAAGLPLEGTCEGQMACSTCHVIVAAQWFDQLAEASEEEEDMLDFASGARRTSRLACQIDLSNDLDGLTVSVPADARDARGMG